MEKKKVYLGGDIMSAGSNLAREKEYNAFKEAGIDADVYSPVMNKDINDKSARTEEQNNRLAEEITVQDIDRLFESDIVVMCPEQHAIGSLCEMGCLYGWKYLAGKMQSSVLHIAKQYNIDLSEKDWYTPSTDTEAANIQMFIYDLGRLMLGFFAVLDDKKIFAHYFDIRTNHLNEKDWRRSFSINQMLYGMILAATDDNMLHNSFEEVLPLVKDCVNNKEESDATDE